MPHTSPPDLLALHGVRLLGYADLSQLAARFDLDPAVVTAVLERAAERGEVTETSFADAGGWSLTEAGRQHNEAQLAEELDAVGARATVTQVHEDFLPLNETVAAACTAVQLDPERAAYDQAWQELSSVAAELKVLQARLCEELDRFAGYHARFASALFRADEDRAYIAGTSVDSCHKVWFELHEDLIASLGITR